MSIKSNGWERNALLGSIKEHLTEDMTVAQWDALAKEKKYPSSSRLIYVFGSWSKVKEALGWSGNRTSYTEEHLIEIAKKHQTHFTTKRKWREYAVKHNLPSDTVYINVFETWNKAKEILSLQPTTATNPTKYTSQDIIEIIKEHKEHLTSRAAWDQYVKGKDLPTYKTMRKHFTWEKILSIADRPMKYRYSEEQIMAIVKKELETFRNSTLQEWNEFAKKNQYPTSSVFLKRYGTWNKAKSSLLSMISKKRDT